MSDISSTPFGAAEHCRLDNWAAEYAKKLFVAEAAKRTEEITDITKSGGTIDAKISTFNTDMVQPIADNVESNEQSIYNITKSGGAIDQRIAAYDSEVIGAAADLPSIDGVKPANLVAAVNALSGVDGDLREAIDNIVVQRGVTAAEMNTALANLEMRETEARSNEDRLIWNTLGTSKAVRNITPIKTGEITSKGTYVVTQPTSVTDAISCISDALDYERDARMKYSTTPKRIGTWIDGLTPVWRVAYCETFDTLWTSGYRSIDIPVKDTAKIFTVHAEFSAMAAQTPCYVDDRPVEYSGVGDIKYPTGSTQQFEGFYGVLEFVTAASNVNT